MRTSVTLAVVAVGLLVLAAGSRGQTTADKERTADREALKKLAQEFAQEYEKGDAKALAALWTETGEYHDEGVVLRGRPAIEKAYADFFKAKPKTKIEVDVRSIRFPSRDTAIEEGVLRQKPAGAALPTSTRYSALHVREDGKWKIASVTEWGAGDDKLEDVAWLIGSWNAKAKDRELTSTYEWNAKKNQIRNNFAVKDGGKVTASGTQIIALDPQSGRLRSWMHDDDGGHGQSLWQRDGNRWVQEALGVLPDGRETSAINILTRLGDDEYLWRSTQRTVGGAAVPDAEPVKVTRVKASK